MMGKLDNKAILVCGGATGIGAETARQLCEAGARVVIGDVNLEAAQHTASGCDAVALQYDQADVPSIEAMVEQAAAHLGGLDGVFANVADLKVILDDGDLLSNDIAIWERTLQVDVIGTAMVLRACLPHLLERGGGAIVCTSSGASIIGEPVRPAYAAAKAGINALCRHISSRWGRQGIRANSIAPGLVVTPQLKEVLDAKTLDNMLAGSKSPRHGEPADIAGAVCYLMSDEASWVNGQTWHVNGGVYYSS